MAQYIVRHAGEDRKFTYEQYEVYQEELAEPGQGVKGVIIALDEDLRLKRALSVTNNIEFYSYKVSFALKKT